MQNRPRLLLVLVGLVSTAILARAENLALRARVSASSSYSAAYAADRVADGHVPEAGRRADVGFAWCAKGNHHPDGVDLVMTWPAAVTVAEIHYYGRTGWRWDENWKVCTVYAEGQTEPIARMPLQAGHGPQPIRLAEPVVTRQIRLHFKGHNGGPNPGASEIEVYAEPVGVSSRALVKPTGHPRHLAADYRASPALSQQLQSGGLGFQQLLVVQRHHVESSHVYTYHCEGQRDGGGLYLLNLASGQLDPLVETPHGQILGCDLSFDGRTVLFSWRQGETYQVYTVGVDGSGLRQLTQDEFYNYDACWLPDGGIAFLSTRAPRYAYCWTSPAGILHRMDADGSGVRQLSANYLNDFTPTVLHDGRLLYGRWEYVDRPAIPIQSLWTMNADGTNLQGFYGNRILDPATFIEPQAVPGTHRVLCTMTGHNGSCQGAIGLIDPEPGPNAAAGILNLTPDVPIHDVQRNSNGPRGPYCTPFPVGSTHYLVSRDGTILLRDFAGTEEAVVLPRDGLGYYHPRPVTPRERPDAKPSLLEPDAPPEAIVLLQDVYTGLESHVEPGSITRIAVVQEIEKSRFADVKNRAFGFQFPVVSCGATYAPKKVWGYADVEADGSAHFKVPAGLPLYFMALDGEGRALQHMRTFTHFMPGEKQGCVGCHAHRTHRAPQRRALALAAQRPPQDLVAPDWGRRGFSYAHVVQPVLDRHCATCHAPPAPEGGIDLAGDATDFFNTSYETLARENKGRYTRWISTLNGQESNILDFTPLAWGSPASPLAELIASGHPDDEGEARIDLPQPDRRRLYAWMDLNVPYYGTSSSYHYDLEGCRRLLPEELEPVLQEIAGRRCTPCHEVDKLPRSSYVRIEHPEWNRFLLAPLARAAGGAETCGQAVFAGTDDPDYRKVIQVFEGVQQLMARNPRVDMRPENQ